MERTEDGILKGKEKNETSQGLPPRDSTILLCLVDTIPRPHSQGHLLRDTLPLLAGEELLPHPTRGL